MLTLRENLLSRPWQERRYIQHRHKVETALPVIDNKPPLQHLHVNCKLKKHQREKERCAQIVSDNFTLLQHLSVITRTSRVDNVWDEPPPNFLNRVGIYRIRDRKLSTQSDEVSDRSEVPKTRKGRCLGCHPHRYVKKELIPEERIPFPPPKKRVSTKSQDSFEKTSTKNITDTSSQKETKQESDVPRPKRENSKKAKKKYQSEGSLRTRRAIKRETQSLELSRGSLTLKIRFPFDSGLVYTDRGQDKIIQRERCHCAAYNRRRAASQSP
ncbi:uncharacterized protein [Halyomorpha halys]|uniref:uncharacterized protein n=1 Tax=Halyomorpha halys TaxID=286706 RepID=UPI0006D4F465|nr:uncharacterized protein LOC106686336 [Halyomorpha halys]